LEEVKRLDRFGQLGLRTPFAFSGGAGRTAELTTVLTPPPTVAPQNNSTRLPEPGEIRKGYRFKGGNPAKKENWEKVQ
jgi:hypothetical protein